MTLSHVHRPETMTAVPTDKMITRVLMPSHPNSSTIGAAMKAVSMVTADSAPPDNACNLVAWLGSQLSASSTVAARKTKFQPAPRSASPSPKDTKDVSEHIA